jgi:phage terminase large subunit-like protein
MNTAPDKKKAPDKIDDMVALLMAVGMATAADGETVIGSDYELLTV